MTDPHKHDALKAMCVAMAIFSIAAYAGTAIIMEHQNSKAAFWRFMWSDGNAVIQDVTTMFNPIPQKNGAAHADERR